MELEPFRDIESEVRVYCRNFPTVFDRADGALLYDERGREYIDFWAGAGTLNYGHNHPYLREQLIAYLNRGGIAHGLDLSTTAKRNFLERFHAVILAPRGLDYKVQFPGPTGTNAIEAALKLARRVTGRQNVVCFTNGYHGVSLGALATTGNGGKRQAAGVSLAHTTRMPFAGYLGESVDTLDLLEAMLDDPGSGLDAPAAILLETIQAEGGVLVAPAAWLKRLQALAQRAGALLIVDDIQVGCGRTGPFFSFEAAGLYPDIVCLSKSISGYGMPMALVLLRRELDLWKPGEHNGTFRGNNLAFVTAAAALHFWEDSELSRGVARKAQRVGECLTAIAARLGEASVRGRGLIQGLVCHPPELADQLSRACFERGLVIETAGSRDQVLKVLPPLVIDDALLERGLDILAEAAADVSRPASIATSAA
jgi:diaminobutyrate-2-oxoglutarate transaminase